MSCNLHILLHLPQIVRDLGPIWICSCFPFEDLNGKLKKLVHGSKCADLQIHYGVSLFINTYSPSQELLVEGTASYSFCKRLHSPTKQMKLQSIGELVAIVGTLRIRQQVPLDVQEAFANKGIEAHLFIIFRKLLKNKMVYSSEIYTQ